MYSHKEWGRCIYVDHADREWGRCIHTGKEWGRCIYTDHADKEWGRCIFADKKWGSWIHADKELGRWIPADQPYSLRSGEHKAGLTVVWYVVVFKLHFQYNVTGKAEGDCGVNLVRKLINLTFR